MFQFDRVALLYYKDDQDYCKSVMDDVEATLSDPDLYPVRIVWKGELQSDNEALTRSTLQAVKSRARIVLLCAISGPEKRNYLISIAQQNMTTNEYVHILLTMRSIGYGVQTSLGKKTCENLEFENEYFKNKKVTRTFFSCKWTNSTLGVIHSST